MSESTSQFRAIASRRQAIDVELDRLRLRVAELESEYSELEIAARVLSRLGLVTAPAEPQLFPNQPNGSEKTTHVQKILDIIKDFDDAGIGGASSSQILAEMEKRWNITDPNVVRPTLWRMVKGNTLIKHGEVYSIIRNIQN